MCDRREKKMKTLFAVIVAVLLGVAFAAVENGNFELTIKHSLDNRQPGTRGKVTSRGFSKKSNVVRAKIEGLQQVDAHSLMSSEYYHVIVETGGEPLIASMKPVCALSLHCIQRCFSFFFQIL